MKSLASTTKAHINSNSPLKPKLKPQMLNAKKFFNYNSSVTFCKIAMQSLVPRPMQKTKLNKKSLKKLYFIRLFDNLLFL